MMKKHIDAFFINYPTSLFAPTAFLMANSDTLCNVERYLETSVKHVPYEERSFKDKKSSQVLTDSEPQMSWTKEQIKANNDALLRMLKGTATG